ncbi:uncharacterized protein BXZ73DRAFT_53828 [Epithele typhae]|uniref:uncharacterized protein n=1 Tax=Epithele typhae TaxID=378194 RepID=UPI0020073AE2|nr:uncharacterized protein BXZ73DRAFT_53828 [Epithele typhae]KAH9916415.1 hypothetical protein BXZ73DRAFT_53828 [Epithele typhae]
MASFLSKVFPRKKDKDTSKRNSSPSLLEGKFEAVAHPSSPSAAKFADIAQQPGEHGRVKEKEKEKDGGFTLFKPKSRPRSPPPSSPKTVSNAPHLTLNLPVPKEPRSRALGVVFEADPNDVSTLPDNIIGERRLSPLETLLLVRACSTALINHGGLETLGVMHPFWYSASPDAQRRLISLFLLSLGPKSPITTLSPSPSSASASFDSELEYSRSPHDVAAVFRWALRHLRLEGESFGRDSSEWKWYETFAEAERTKSYPNNAFSDALVPQLPPSHHQLLVATLDLVSSFASHAETSGVSGSKLSKFLGIWLLAAKRSEDGEDWPAFYARWERAGRILEHLFLAHIRDEMASEKVPLRLVQLTKGYPYHGKSESSGSTTTGDELPARPRFSTLRYDALFVRVETESDSKAPKTKSHALRLLMDALKSELDLKDAQLQAAWEAIQKTALATDEPEPILTHVDSFPGLSRIFTDETTRILSFLPSASEDIPTIRLPQPPYKRSTSANTTSDKPTPAENNGSGKHTPATSPQTPTSPKDWMDFSSGGFGESTLGKDFAKTLMDKDVEVTIPPAPIERKVSSRKRVPVPTDRRSSVDSPNTDSVIRASEIVAPPKPQAPKSKTTLASLVKLDEAFVDFWNDSLLDPVSSGWPNALLAQLNAIPGVEVDGKPIGWLIVEQRFVAPPSTPAPALEPAAANTRRAASPRPSVRSESSGRKSSAFSLSARKRLTFFSSSSQSISSAAAKSEVKASSARKRASKGARVGEMGEILPEVKESDEKSPASPAKKEAAAPAKPSVVVSPATPAPAPSAAASPASEGSLSPMTPSADDFPAIPVVAGVLATTDAGAVAVEALKTDDGELATCCRRHSTRHRGRRDPQSGGDAPARTGGCRPHRRDSRAGSRAEHERTRGARGDRGEGGRARGGGEVA